MFVYVSDFLRYVLLPAIVIVAIATPIYSYFSETKPRKEFISGLSVLKDGVDFNYKDVNFNIKSEIVYRDNSVKVIKVYINGDHVCTAYELQRVWATYREIKITAGKPEKEIFEIIEQANKVFWRRVSAKPVVQSDYAVKGFSYFNSEK